MKVETRRKDLKNKKKKMERAHVCVDMYIYTTTCMLFAFCTVKLLFSMAN